ncbi:MAG: DUF1294 domain-containing protein [Oscillospiraceae bacterium]|nr:DUF1294 domain-containing protein [Oscillospiraceae bacterium]
MNTDLAVLSAKKDTAILIFYFIINLLAFALYGTDKNKAKKNLWRIPENILFLTAFLGGAFGALCGMECFHHKTKKKYFWVLNFLALAIHVVLMYFLLFRS